MLARAQACMDMCQIRPGHITNTSGSPCKSGPLRVVWQIPSCRQKWRVREALRFWGILSLQAAGRFRVKQDITPITWRASRDNPPHRHGKSAREQPRRRGACRQALRAQRLRIHPKPQYAIMSKRLRLIPSHAARTIAVVKPQLVGRYRGLTLTAAWASGPAGTPSWFEHEFGTLPLRSMSR